MRPAPDVEASCMGSVSYRIILEPEPDGSAYNVIIPAFPHAHTFGGTVPEAMANAREIIELELEAARPPGTLKAILEDVGMTADELRALLQGK